MMVVVDASVLCPALALDDDLGVRCSAAIRGRWLHCPEVAYPEVISCLRRLRRLDRATQARCDDAVLRLARAPISVHPQRPLLARAWELRDRFAASDAMYVALAESMGIPLVTADTRLASTVRKTCDVILVATAS